MGKREVSAAIAVQKAISERLGIDPGTIRWNSSLREELKITDSDLVAIEMEVEEELGIASIESRILTARTVGDIIHAFCPPKRKKRTLLRKVLEALKALFGA